MNIYYIQHKKILLIFLVILLTINNTFSQSDNVQVKNNIKNAFIFAPFGLFDILNPSLQIGYIRGINYNYSIQIEAGMIIEHSVFGMGGLHRVNRKNNSYSGYKLRLELKRRLRTNRNGMFNLFVASELFYTKNYANINDIFINSENDSYTDFFINDSHKYGFNVKMNMMFVFGSFLLEVSGGPGISYYNVEHFDRVNNNDKFATDIYGYLYEEGEYFRFNLAANVRIGYIF